MPARRRSLQVSCPQTNKINQNETTLLFDCVPNPKNCVCRCRASTAQLGPYQPLTKGFQLNRCTHDHTHTRDDLHHADAKTSSTIVNFQFTAHHKCHVSYQQPREKMNFLNRKLQVKGGGGWSIRFVTAAHLGQP
jgi:hypothetical protein